MDLILVAALAAPAVVSAQTFELLHSFSDPERNASRLFQDTDGTLYGTFESGGPTPFGGIFKRLTDGTFVVLHRFSFSDGAFPLGGVIKGADGAFYGTTFEGGASGFRTIFKWNGTTLETLHSFATYPDGGYPRAGVIQGTDGALYGTTSRRPIV